MFLFELKGATRKKDLFKLKVLDFCLWFGILIMFAVVSAYAFVRLITG